MTVHDNLGGPRAVAHRLIDGITGQRWADLADLYAEDAVVDRPFVIPPEPVRLSGRQIREYFAAAPARPLELKASNLVLHETADPEVVIIEYDYEALVTATGRTFTVANILVIRVRDGRIVESRDYHDHRAFAEAFQGRA